MSLSPFLTYRIYFAEDVPPTTNDAFFDYLSSDAPSTLSNIITTNAIVSNLNFDTLYFLAMAAVDSAGNVSPLSTNFISVFLEKFALTQGVAEAHAIMSDTSGVQVAWDAFRLPGTGPAIIVTNCEGFAAAAFGKSDPPPTIDLSWKFGPPAAPVPPHIAVDSFDPLYAVFDANIPPGPAQPPGFLVLLDFGYVIPTNAIIHGITVGIIGHASNNVPFERQLDVQLTTNGFTPIGPPPGVRPVILSNNVDGLAFAGGSNDTWGVPVWNPALITLDELWGHSAGSRPDGYAVVYQ